MLEKFMYGGVISGLLMSGLIWVYNKLKYEDDYTRAWSCPLVVLTVASIMYWWPLCHSTQVDHVITAMFCLSILLCAPVCEMLLRNTPRTKEGDVRCFVTIATVVIIWLHCLKIVSLLLPEV